MYEDMQLNSLEHLQSPKVMFVQISSSRLLSSRSYWFKTPPVLQLSLSCAHISTSGEVTDKGPNVPEFTGETVEKVQRRLEYAWGQLCSKAALQRPSEQKVGS